MNKLKILLAILASIVYTLAAPVVAHGEGGKGSITIQNFLVDAPAAATSKQYKFKVTGTSEAASYKDGTTITLIGNGVAKLSDLEEGNYHIEEVDGDIDKYSLVVTGIEEDVKVVANADTSVNVTNTYKAHPGSLKIVIGLTRAPEYTLGKGYHFDIVRQGDNKTYNAYTGVDALDGSKENELIVNDIEPGTYTVKCTDAEHPLYNETVTYTNNPVTITSDNQSTVGMHASYVYKRVTLTIENKVIGAEEAVANKTYTIEMVDAQNGTLYLKPNTSHWIDYFKSGDYTLRVSDPSVEGYNCITTVTGGTGNIEDGFKVRVNGYTKEETITVTHTYTSTASSTLDFTYIPQVKKVLRLPSGMPADWDYSDKPFTFQLTGYINGSQKTIEATTDASGVATFEPIQLEYKGDGNTTYSFILKEVEGSYDGVTYDKQPHTLTVERYDNDNHILLDQQAADGGVPVVYNDYTETNEETVSFAPEIQKVVSGTDWNFKRNDFTFEVVDAYWTHQPNPESVTEPLSIPKGWRAATDALGKAKFSAFTFPKTWNANATFTFKIKEVKGNNANIQYDEATHTLEYKYDNNYLMEIDWDGKMVYGDEFNPDFHHIEETPTITNIYKQQRMSFGVRKKVVDESGKVVDWDFANKPFYAELTSPDGSPLPENTRLATDYGGNFTWTVPVDDDFESRGCFTYEIREIAGDDSNITYDTNTHTLKQTGLSPVGNTLWDGEDALQEIVNTYQSKTLSLELQKEVENTSWDFNKYPFSFDVTSAEWTHEDTLGKRTEVLNLPDDMRGVTDASGKVTFPEIKLPASLTGEETFTFKIKEVKGSYTGVTYDETEHTLIYKYVGEVLTEITLDGAPVTSGELPIFTNAYEKPTLSFRVKKLVRGDDGYTIDDWDFATNPFTIELSSPDGSPLPANTNIKCDEQGVFTWTVEAEPDFDQRGGYTYEVKEIDTHRSDFSYDTETHTIERPQLSAQSTLWDGETTTPTISNYYLPAPKDCTFYISFQKRVVDAEGNDTDWNFEVLPFTFDLESTNAPLPEKTSAHTDENGLVAFEPITLSSKRDEPVTYSYTLKEFKSKSLSSIMTYTNDHIIDITLLKGDVTSLRFDGEEVEAIPDITNTYTPAPTEQVVEPYTILKSLRLAKNVLDPDGNYLDWDFQSSPISFEIKPVGDAPAPHLSEAKTNEMGFVDWGNVYLTFGNTYTYEVSEVAGDIAGMGYETAPKTLQITVADDGTTTTTLDGVEMLDGFVVVNNTYTEPEQGAEPKPDDTPNDTPNETPDTTEPEKNDEQEQVQPKVPVIASEPETTKMPDTGIYTPEAILCYIGIALLTLAVSVAIYKQSMGK